jgi:hypothetical protein
VVADVDADFVERGLGGLPGVRAFADVLRKAFSGGALERARRRVIGIEQFGASARPG